MQERGSSANSTRSKPREVADIPAWVRKTGRTCLLGLHTFRTQTSAQHHQTAQMLSTFDSIGYSAELNARSCSISCVKFSFTVCPTPASKFRYLKSSWSCVFVALSFNLDLWLIFTAQSTCGLPPSPVLHVSHSSSASFDLVSPLFGDCCDQDEQAWWHQNTARFHHPTKSRSHEK